MADTRFNLLFVCRANMCRSPLAERITRQAMDARLGSEAAGEFTIASAGTHAVRGRPMHPHSRQVIDEYQADGEGFLSRLVDLELIMAADLILTASRRHRAHCVVLAPTAIGRIFTIRQFGRLAVAAAPGGGQPEVTAPVGLSCGVPGHAGGGADPADATAVCQPCTSQCRPVRARGLVAAARTARSRLQPVSAAEDDLRDPVLCPIDDFRDCARQIKESIDSFVDIIAKP